MRITLKMFASLGDYLPAGHHNNQINLDVPEGTSIMTILETNAIPLKLVHLVLVNGTYIEPEDRITRPLKEGDVLALWPPVAGG